MFLKNRLTHQFICESNYVPRSTVHNITFCRLYLAYYSNVNTINIILIKIDETYQSFGAELKKGTTIYLSNVQLCYKCVYVCILKKYQTRSNNLDVCDQSSNP